MARSDKIEEGLKIIDQKLSRKNNWRNLSREEFVHNASVTFAFLHNLQPFVAGNGCAQRIFFEKIAEAAGHKLDFSVVTEARMQFAGSAALSFGDNEGNVAPLRHLFEDISNPEKVSVLKEFIQYTSDIKGEDIRDKVIVMPNEGETYTGFYKSCSLDSIMLMVKDSYVLCKKDYLPPEKLKTLKLGDSITFTASISKDCENILIPEERLASLTEEEIIEKIQKDFFVQKCRKEIKSLSKLIYGNSEMLNEHMDMINIGSSAGEQNVRYAVTDLPKPILKSSGTKMLGRADPKYQQTEKNVFYLDQKINSYISAVLHSRKRILKEHSLEQERCGQVVKMPCKTVQDILSMSGNISIEILNSDFLLCKHLQDFMCKVGSRLSQSERKAIGDNNYNVLAESIGISVSKAKRVTQIIKRAQEVCQKEKVFKADRSRIMATGFSK
ncbi:Bartonella effector protein (Bep), substrate of VirB T4SS [Bartonella clarridgeiae 73]|uniref:Bartonella effector protein (Bep), substrate of VirB T4SS n=1 Tax=Bartonella clarridgeiae (strain CCUG 45776 / CIP 104772 / 73) TaxID=696125 RepID=E6YGE9_BARC7|nr:MAG: hypothetical protein PG977_000851 [Bartonella clarridgeiae]CBI75937.1 Bartonella effector protein (Bep), substrate of VirB T4SS [Bartonella clarridgeiae 73]